jgi:hypothetical protein
LPRTAVFFAYLALFILLVLLVFIAYLSYSKAGQQLQLWNDSSYVLDIRSIF